MSRSVTFNGQTIFKPGAISRVRANSNAQLGSTTNGIVALIGEADGGQPNTVLTISDPALAKETFTSGPLADALRLAFQPSTDPNVSAGAFQVLCYKTNQSTQASTTLPGSVAVLAGTVTGASTALILTVTGGGMTADAHIGRWILVSGEKRRIVDNDVTTITLEKSLSAAPPNTTAFSILENQLTLTSKKYGVEANQIGVEFEAGSGTDKYIVTISLGNSVVEQSPEILGDPALYVRYVGGPALDSGPVTVATTSVITVDVAAAPLLNAYAGMVLVLPNGLQRLIASNTAADPAVITLTAGHELTAAQAAEIVGGTAYIKNITSAVASITGAAGVATGFTTTCVLVPVSTTDNLSLTFNVNETLRQFIDRVNATTNFRLSAGAGINLDTTLMKTFDFGTRATNVDVRFDSAITPSTKGTFRRDLQGLVDWINSFSSLATAVRTTGAAGEGDEIPSVTGGVSGTPLDTVIYLIGGTRGISANSNFQAGFDAMMLNRINHIIPLISQDLTNEGYGSTATFSSVSAQLSSFVAEANSSGKNECGAYLGMAGTKSALITKLNQLNSPDIQMVGQKVTHLDVDGNLKEFQEWGLAVQAAGYRAGISEVGEPLTHKPILCSGLSNDSSWSTKDIGNVNDLLKAGLLFAEQKTSGGFRWVRDITSWVNDDSEFYIAGSTRDACRFMAYDFRTQLEDRFTGPKATLATVASVREFAAALLSEYKNQNIIVESLDPETNTKLLPGWRNLRVFLSGNTLTVRVELFPVVGISFQLVDITLQNVKLVA